MLLSWLKRFFIYSVFLGLVSTVCAADPLPAWRFFQKPQTNDLKPFTTDGCSLFPDASWVNEDEWCGCCVAHDIAYWRGGTEDERLAADQQLRDCVEKNTNDKVLANLMFEGVRVGGSPYFYNWYRWAYGWPYGRFYQPLTAAEQARAKELLVAYLDKAADGPSCPE